MNPTIFNFGLSGALRVVLLLAGCVQGLLSFAQVNVNMPFNSGASTFTINPPTTCSFNFFDDAGPGGVYSNLSNPATSVVTFAPSIPGNKVRVVFTSFGVEEFFDALFVYDGATAMAPQISSGNPAAFVFKAGGFWGITPPNNIASNAVQATAGNASGALTFQFESDATPIPNTYPGWEAVVAELTPGVCTLQNLAPLTVNLPSNGCTADVLAPLPGYSPGGCNLNLAIRYRINGGPVTSVMGFPANVLIPDLPAGANIVTWELINPCGGAVISVVNQSITIQDKTLPVLSCPPSVTLNLGPGECGEQHLYGPVTATDNCLFMSPEAVVTHPDLTNFNNFFAGITFDVRNTGPDPVYITGFTAPIAPGPHTVQVWLATSSHSAVPVMNNPLAWSLIGQVNVNSTAVGFFDQTNIPIGVIILQPGETKGIYMATTDGSFMRYTNGNAVSSDGRVSIISNGHGAGAYPFSNTSVPRTFVGAVKYTVPVAGGTVSQIAGLPSGAEFPIGTTTNIFRAFDKAGNSATCSFTVTVNEYTGPSGSIVCNDAIVVALDEFCTAKLTADDVLEGGNYGCYNKYPVEVDRVPPFGNGPWQPAEFTAADVGKTYRLRVTNPGNGLICDKTDVTILDFLPPALECSLTPIDIPGNLPPSPIDTKAVDITYSFLPPGLPKTVMDFQTIEIEIPVGAPADMTINDVDFRLRISGDPFNLNMNAVLESPSGTIVTLYDQFTGCAPSPLFARFDDEGVNSIACADLTTNKNVRIPASIGQQLSAFDGEPVAGVWKLRVTDLDAFADQSSIEIAELIVNTAYKYTTGFPNGLTWPNPKIIQVNNNTFVVKAPLIDACSDVTLSYVDQSMPGTCQSGFLSIITRTWQAIDASGNTATCVETIRLLRADFDDVVPPPNYDDIDEESFACGGPYPTPDWIESQGLQGYPEVFGMSNGGAGINWTYTDNIIQTLCDGTYTIRRRWLLDVACSGVFELEQIIRVVDEKGPEIDTPADMEVSTGSSSCCAVVPLPSAMVFDSCSRINNIQARVEVNDIQTGLPVNTFTYAGSLTNFPGNNPAGINDTLAVFGNTACLPVGQHTVYYIAQDACGNTSSVSFTVSVVDYSPPSAACDEFTVVSLGWDDPNDCYLPDSLGCQFAGVTWVHASVFDDGSTDNCSNIRFRVRRQVPYSSCITGLSKTPCPGLPGGVSEFTLATQESDSIKFYCCEVGTTQKVILRVYQLEPDGSYSLEPDGTPIYNECEVEVTVQDKIKPSCQAPPNTTVSCENFDPSLWAYGLPKVEDNCCLDSTVSHMGIKGLEHEVNYSSFDTVCSRGTIRRLFTVSDCQGQTRNCSQQIVVNYDQDYFIKFPDDVMITFCDSSGIYGEPQFFGEDCELLAVSYVDQFFTVVPDVCFKIERTWTITNWCSYNPNGQCINIPNPNPNNTLNHPNNLPGPIVSAPGTTGLWAPTVVKVNPTDPVATNYSAFWNPNANCYKYKQIIKIVDQVAPVIETCAPDTVPYCDISENDPQLWNQNWFDPVHQTKNLCEAPVDLNITVSDACSQTNLNIRYLLFLDLDGDGSMETVVNSATPPPAGSVRYNNANTPNFSGGTLRQFDGRAVSPSGLYQFSLEQTISGNKVVAGVRWNVPGSSSTYSLPQLPHGVHKIKWFVSDGCGNESVCEYMFTVKDCKVPSVVCINGLSTNIVLPMGAMIGVQDLVEYGIDNCTPSNQLTFSMRKEGTGTGFPVDSLGNPVEMLFYFCNELGPNPIEIWAKDKAGNASFCKTYLLVQNNPGTGGPPCSPGTSASVAGFLGTELDFGLEEGHVQISGQNPAGPTFDLHEMTDQNGVYQFNNAIPLFSNYSVIPSKDDNPLNGVSTYDLVLISRHILGLEPLNSPYKMIAADANKSGSITTFDVVELRKLILGIYTQLPANTSWRFVDADFDFPSSNNPFQSVFPESKSLGSIQQSMMDDDFVAIKVGDVNGNAIANTFMQAEDRSAGQLYIDAADQPLEKDETVTVWFKPAGPVAAYQMTMQFFGLEVLEVLPGDGMDEGNFAVFAPRPELGEAAALTTSINGTQASFGIRFRALRKGQLSQMILASSRITRSEAYSESGEAMDVALRFLNDQQAVINGVGFELYQNQPNPFVNKTMIGFHLPEAGEAILRVFDETGRLLHMERGDFAKGYGTFMVDKSMLSGDGVYFYQVESVDAFASRKMIQTN